MRKIRKTICFFFTIFFLLSSGIYACAEQLYIIDGAAVLTQKDSLEIQAQELYQDTGFVAACVICRNGVSGYEKAQELYSDMYGSAPGVLLLDALEDDKVYLFPAPLSAPVLDEKQSAQLASAYDSHTDFDSAVRAYLDAAEELFGNVEISESPKSANTAIISADTFLSQDTCAVLEVKAKSIYEQYDCGIFVVADNAAVSELYDRLMKGNILSLEENKNAVFMLVSISEENYRIVPVAEAKKVFSYEANEYIAGKYMGSIQNGIDEDIVYGFLQGCEELLYKAENGYYISGRRGGAVGVVLLFSSIIAAAAVPVVLFRKFLKKKLLQSQDV